jgi:hypothetical protein
VVDLASNPVSVNAVGQVAIRAELADGRELILRADTAPASARCRWTVSAGEPGEWAVRGSST